MANERISALLAEYRRNAGYTQGAVAEKLGIARTTVNSWEHSMSEPDIVTFLELCRIYGIENVFTAFSGEDYTPVKAPYGYGVLNGSGKKKVQDYVSDLTQIKKYCREEKQKKIYAFSIPYYDIAVSAGTGQFLAEESQTQMALTDRPPKDADFLVRVSGDSMEPKYHDGDKLFIRRQSELERGKAGIFIVNGTAFLKELGEGELLSYNKKYSPIKLGEYDEVRCVGTVVGILK